MKTFTKTWNKIENLPQLYEAVELKRDGNGILVGKGSREGLYKVTMIRKWKNQDKYTIDLYWIKKDGTLSDYYNERIYFN